MKKYYVVNHGQVVSQSWDLGEFEDIYDAKRFIIDSGFEDIDDGDTLCDGVQPDAYDGFWRQADGAECVDMLITDDSIEGVPAGLWWFDDDPDTFYERDGSEWKDDDDE